MGLKRFDAWSVQLILVATSLLRTTAVTDVVNNLITAIADFDNKLDVHLRRGGDALADKT